MTITMNISVIVAMNTTMRIKIMTTIMIIMIIMTTMTTMTTTSTTSTTPRQIGLRPRPRPRPRKMTINGTAMEVKMVDTQVRATKVDTQAEETKIVMMTTKETKVLVTIMEEVETIKVKAIITEGTEETAGTRVMTIVTTCRQESPSLLPRSYVPHSSAKVTPVSTTLPSKSHPSPINRLSRSPQFPTTLLSKLHQSHTIPPSKSRLCRIPLPSKLHQFLTTLLSRSHLSHIILL